MQDVAIARFNRDSVGRKGCVLIRPSEWRMFRKLVAQVDGYVDILQRVFLALQFPQRAALQQMRGKSRELTPSVETSVRVHRKRREITLDFRPASRLPPPSSL